MKRFALIAAVGASLLLVGCDARTVSVRTDPSKTTYSRDARTNTCFASIGRGTSTNFLGNADSFSTSAVICSPEILELVPSSQR